MQITVDLSPIMKRLDEIDALSSAETSKEILSAIEAAAVLDISLSHLYRLTSERRIQYYRPAEGRIYFKRADLEAYLLTGRVSTREEISRLADKWRKRDRK